MVDVKESLILWIFTFVGKHSIILLKWNDTYKLKSTYMFKIRGEHNTDQEVHTLSTNNVNLE